MPSGFMRLRRAAWQCMLFAAVVVTPCGAAHAQIATSEAATTTSVAPALAASGAIQFPGLPLRRDSEEDTSGLQAFGWLAVILGGFAVAVLIVARSKGGAMKFPAANLQRLGKAGSTVAPTVINRTTLAANVAVYALKWGDEELLVGSTTQSLTLLARRPCESSSAADTVKAAQ
ncbi:MAG: hypothetical protein H7255_14490 [Ramlibacter sp.]|nr:hypothetical protein [Ramlibacter sp.]